MRKKYNIILSAEESFARIVALGVMVKKPLTVWHYLIPGMFILDFLRRTSEVNKYSKHFLFPRKLAIDASLDIINGEDRGKRISRIGEEVEKWLRSLKLYSLGLYNSQMEEINLLIEHYSALLNAKGDSYNALVKDAYNNQENYKAFLYRLASKENDVDQAIVKKLGESESLRDRLLAEKQQVEKLRKRNVDIIFLN